MAEKMCIKQTLSQVPNRQHIRPNTRKLTTNIIKQTYLTLLSRAKILRTQSDFSLHAYNRAGIKLNYHLSMKRALYKFGRIIIIIICYLFPNKVKNIISIFTYCYLQQLELTSLNSLIQLNSITVKRVIKTKLFRNRNLNIQ